MLVFEACVLLLISSALAKQQCPERETVDVTNGQRIDKTIIHGEENLVYKEEEYFTNTSNPLQTLGCICLKKYCLRKCCPPAESIDFDTDKCVKGSTKEFKPPVDDTSAQHHKLIIGLECGKDQNRYKFSSFFEDEPFWINTMNGKIYHKDDSGAAEHLDLGEFCVDNFVSENETKLDIHMCVDGGGDDAVGVGVAVDQENAEDGKTQPTFLAICSCFAAVHLWLDNKFDFSLSSSSKRLMRAVNPGELVSCVFLLVTLAVYCLVPELRSAHGLVVMVWVAALCVGFLSASVSWLVLSHVVVSPAGMPTIVVISYFTLLTAFFWLNVLSFDIWWVSSDHPNYAYQFVCYCVYAFGVPAILTAVLLGLHFTDDPATGQHDLTIHGSFLHGTKRHQFFDAPIICVLLMNLVFFILTVKALMSANLGPNRKAEQIRKSLILKLLLLMGFSWAMEVIPSFFPSTPAFLVVLFDTFNTLTGVVVFIIIVCQKKVLRALRKRYYELTGRPEFSNRDTAEETGVDVSMLRSTAA